MKIFIRPLADPEQEVEMTDGLIGSIAKELSARFGGNEQLNWLEAEYHLQCILAGAQNGVYRSEDDDGGRSLRPETYLQRAAREAREEARRVGAGNREGALAPSTLYEFPARRAGNHEMRRTAGSSVQTNNPQHDTYRSRGGTGATA